MRRPDPYTRALMAHTGRQIAWRAAPARGFVPRGALGAAVSGLGDLGDGTGIDFIDQNLTAIRTQVDEAALAAKITAAAAIAGGVVSLLLLLRTAH
jgi:hypothetical protein